MAKRTLEERFWEKVDKTGDCWEWTAALKKGYGTFWDGQRQARAHRVAYELVVGQIPDGLSIDHLCRNKRCVNPDHLEPVTQRENVLRGVGLSARNARKTHCKRGHPLDGSNLYEWRDMRRCRACAAMRDPRYRTKIEDGET